MRNTLQLTQEAIDTLEVRIKKGKHAARVITRCRILLLVHQKKRYDSIASMLGVSHSTITRIKKRYLSGGVKGAIYDLPRSGRPLRFTDKQEASITALACSTPPKGYGRWTLRLLADRAVELALVEGLSHTGVRGILKKTR